MQTLKQLCQLAKTNRSELEAMRNSLLAKIQGASGDQSAVMDELNVLNRVLEVSGALIYGGQPDYKGALDSNIKTLIEETI